MRVTTAFNRVLALPGTSVMSVSFTGDGLVLGVRPTWRRHRCPCGRQVAGRYDVSTRRWRHLDFGACKVWLEAAIARVRCPRCRRVRTEQVPWARDAARLTRDFEDLIGWLAQRMDKSSVSRLLRCSWRAVDQAVQRVVTDHLDDTRLDGLYRIGVDEISYKRGHTYLTVVADHDSGNVVWVAKDRSNEAFEGFFDALGDNRARQLEAVSMDAATGYRSVAAARAPQAQRCLDPFHVMKWVNEALDKVYQQEPATPAVWNGTRYSRENWRRARTALRTGQERLTDQQQQIVTGIRRHRRRLYRAWELKEELRDLYRTVPPDQAGAYLKAWTTRALRCRIPAMHTLAYRLRRHFDDIVAAVELGLSNSRLEGINSKIRVIQRRGYGHPNPESLTAMIHLCLGGITIQLPTQR